MKISDIIQKGSTTDIGITLIEELINDKEFLKNQLRKAKKAFAFKNDYYWLKRELFYSKQEIESELFQDYIDKIDEIKTIIENNDNLFKRKKAFKKLKELLKFKLE